MSKKKKVENLKMDSTFFKEFYSDLMTLLKAKVLNGSITFQEMNLVFKEIQRLEIEVYEEDIEQITSFVNNFKNGDNVVGIKLPFDNPKAINN